MGIGIAIKNQCDIYIVYMRIKGFFLILLSNLFSKSLTMIRVRFLAHY